MFIKKSCSKYKEKIVCSICKGKGGRHYKTCPLANRCSECNGVNGTHFKSCSKYKEPVTCLECGAKYNHHKKTCSKNKNNTPVS